MIDATKGLRAIASSEKLRRRICAGVLSLCLAVSAGSVAWACGPFLPIALMFNGIHPDLPLKLFASGNLGIVQPGYAKSYLVVAYRYLSGQPLTPSEQASILRMWHSRLETMSSPQESDGSGSGAANPNDEYLKLRTKVLSSDPNGAAEAHDFAFSQNIVPDAVSNALKSLHELIDRFGLHSGEVKNWLGAQDKLFESVAPSASDFPTLPADAAPIIRQQRAYQVAAAQFYTNDLEKAQLSFEAIANDKTLESNAQGLHLRDLCNYMAGRCRGNAALAANDEDQLTAAAKYIRGMIERFPHSEYRPDLEDLLSQIDYANSLPDESLDRLVTLATTPHGDSFGNAVGDLTFLLHSYFDDQGNRLPPDSDDKSAPADVPVEKYDLTDWLITIHQPDDSWESYSVADKKQLKQLQKRKGLHALERWRKTHSLPWFVAALSLNDLLDKNNPDLFQAARKTTTDSKGFCTAQFYLIDALIRSNQKGEADRLLARILSRTDLPPSTRNLFMCQRLMVSGSVTEYLNNIVQSPVTITIEIDPAQLPDDWLRVESQSHFYSVEKVIAPTQANDLNANLPEIYWIRWCGNKSLPSSLRSRIILATWLRSKLLGQDAGLDDELVKAYPFLKRAMSAYKSSSSEAEKRFSLACLIITNWGMSPYLEPGVARHNLKLNEWDDFNANFWLPLPAKTPVSPKSDSAESTAAVFDYNYLGSSSMRSKLQSYAKPALQRLLTNAEKKQADAERLKIWNNHPSKFLGDAIISWAKSHPRDPRVPEMLYHVVKLPRWSAERSAIGTKYSKAAYLLLHQQYPDNPWSAKAEYWY